MSSIQVQFQAQVKPLKYFTLYNKSVKLCDEHNTNRPSYSWDKLSCHKNSVNCKRLFSVSSTIRSFHRAANAILYSRVKPSTVVLMKLLYTNCVPIITYASEVKEFSAVDMRRCHVALNNAIRKVFSYAVWQSIRDLRKSYGYKCIYEIFASTKAKFMANVSSSSNPIVSHLATLSNMQFSF